MPADRSYVAQNTAQRDRLSEFVERASDKELEAPMPAGWTVGQIRGEDDGRENVVRAGGTRWSRLVPLLMGTSRARRKQHGSDW